LLRFENETKVQKPVDRQHANCSFSKHILQSPPLLLLLLLLLLAVVGVDSEASGSLGVSDSSCCCSTAASDGLLGVGQYVVHD
jgi:hypothetical protein